MKRLVLLVVLGTAAPLPAWTQPAPDMERMVSVDPIRCWWRTSKGAVRIGETFELGLTCAVLDNQAVQVVPDESRLAGAVIAMAPYEVVESEHPEDLRTGDRRFFQYQYTMRIINPDAIGADVPIPIMTLHYRVTSRVAANAALQGRDLTYVLPPHSVRVLSLVTADAPDIRDASDESFSAIESLTLRAGTLEVVATTLAVMGALMIVVVLLRLLGGLRTKGAAGPRLMGDYRLLWHAGRALSAVQREADGGWNDGLIGRALSATRLAASAALGRTINQRPVDRAVESGEGRIVAYGLPTPRRKATALSGTTTAEDVARAMARMPVPADAGQRQTLEDLHTALTAFDQALYSRGGEADRNTLDAALARAVAATSRLRSSRIWPKPQVRRWTAGPTVAEHRA